jgi:hypothetical protein
MCGNLRIDPSEECDGKLKKAANGAPGGEPIEEGLNCSADCKKIEDDRCKKCEEKYCHTFASEFAYGIPDAPDIEDMIAGCYTVGYKDKGTVGRVTDAASVAKCSALVECARRNRCDVYDTWSAEAPTRDVKLKPDQSHPGTLEGCLCGEVEPGSGTWSYFFGCNEAPAGKCVQQVYAASNCTDSACVEGNLVIQGVASYYAHYLSMCHRIRCFEVCR